MLLCSVVITNQHKITLGFISTCTVSYLHLLFLLKACVCHTQFLNKLPLFKNELPPVPGLEKMFCIIRISKNSFYMCAFLSKTEL